MTARVLTLTQGSAIATTSSGTAMAGDINLVASYVTPADGATVSSSAASGAAGDITLTMPDEVGILLLDSRGSASAITTFSNSSAGGMISIVNPLAVISNGGAVRAQGRAKIGFHSPTRRRGWHWCTPPVSRSGPNGSAGSSLPTH